MQLGILEEVCWDIELESEKLKTQGFGIERERIIEWKKKCSERCEGGEETGLVHEGFDSGRRRAVWSEMLSFSSYWTLGAHLSVSLTHTLCHAHTYHIAGFESRVKS